MALPRFASLEEATAWANRSKKPEKVQRLVPSEQEEQIALIARVRLHESVYPALRLLFHVPLGGKRNLLEAKKLKAAGTLRGVPDLMLLHAARGFHGWLGEIKALDGKPSAEQKWMIAELRHRGYFASIFYGQDAAWENLLWYVGENKE